MKHGIHHQEEIRDNAQSVLVPKVKNGRCQCYLEKHKEIVDDCVM
jgi:hypothetical protein